MTMVTYNNSFRRVLAAFLAFAVLTPLLMLPAVRVSAQMKKPGMSMGKKLLLVGGAALLLYMWKKHQANKAKEAVTNPGMAGQAMPQLYRSESSGRVYYRDSNHKAVFLTPPAKAVQIPADELQRYAPNYKRYLGRPAPSLPSNAQSRAFTDFDSSVLPSGSVPGPAQ